MAVSRNGKHLLMSLLERVDALFKLYIVGWKLGLLDH